MTTQDFEEKYKEKFENCIEKLKKDYIPPSVPEINSVPNTNTDILRGVASCSERWYYKILWIAVGAILTELIHIVFSLF